MLIYHSNIPLKLGKVVWWKFVWQTCTLTNSVVLLVNFKAFTTGAEIRCFCVIAELLAMPIVINAFINSWNERTSYILRGHNDKNFQVTNANNHSILSACNGQVNDFQFPTYTNALRKEQLTTGYGLIHFITTVVVSITNFTVRNTLVRISTSVFTFFTKLWGFSYNDRKQTWTVTNHTWWLSLHAEAAWPSGLGRWIWNLEVPGSNPPPYCYLDLFSVVPSSTPRPHCANWSASNPLGFLIVYVLFAIFVYLFTVSPISTTVLNTFDT